MVAQVLGAHAQLDGLSRPDRPVLVDPVGDVHEPDHAEREVAVGHQPHRQREREHVQVGRRRDVGEPEAAHRVVGGEVLALDLGAVEHELGVGQRVAAPAADQRQLALQRAG